MPMARLAEYLIELAEILGEPKSVHLVGIEPGSTTLVHEIEHEAIPKVQTRVQAVRLGEGPRDAHEAYKKVNRYLREDNARAVFRKGKTGAKGLGVSRDGRSRRDLPNRKPARHPLRRRHESGRDR